MFSQGERKVGVGEEDCRKWNRTILPTWRRGKRQLSCEWCWMFHTRHLGLVLIVKSKLGLLRSLYIYWSDGFYYKIIQPLWTDDIFWHVAHVWYMGMKIFFSFFILNIFFNRNDLVVPIPVRLNCKIEMIICFNFNIK